MGESPTTQDPRGQADKFRDLARELGCDEDEDAFKAKLRKIAKKRPPGDWAVVSLKDGSGFYPHLTPNGYAMPEMGPTFETEAAAEGWIRDQKRLAADDTGDAKTVERPK